MLQELSFYTLDVFSDLPYTGNPLAVVLGADGLDTAQMQTIAREFNLSETIFVQPPLDPANTARVRIFFPTAEIPFAGHPTLGCAALLAQLRNGAGDFDDRITLEEEAGLVPVTLTQRDGRISGTFSAPVLPVPCAGNVDRELIARALGLPDTGISYGAHAPGLFQGGPAFLYVPLADLDTLATARPIEPYWSQVMEAGGVDSAYLYTPGPDQTHSQHLRARMFSPTAGIPEDPATGSASAILAAQLLRAGDLVDGDNRVQLTQGVEMGRASQIGLTITLRNGALSRVQVSGSAVRISQGTLWPPGAENP